MNPKVEKIARIFCRASILVLEERRPKRSRLSLSDIEELVNDDWRHHEEDARACIAALKTLPREDLIEAWGYPLRNDADWNKMLDHLLK